MHTWLRIICIATATFLGGSANAAADAGKAALHATPKSAPDWRPPAGLLNTMTVHAKVRLPAGGYVSAAGSRLAAFKDEALRGVCTLFNGPAPEMQFQLAVGANSSTEAGLTLRLYDAGTDRVYDIGSGLTFAADTTIGTIVAPLEYAAIEAPTLVTLNVSGGNVSSLEWGAQFGATPGADVGIDYLAPMPGMDGRAVYFIPPVAAAPALKRDVRGSLVGERWQVAVLAGLQSVTLTWDPASIPPGEWHLWELTARDGAAVPGTAIRLGAGGSLAPIPAGEQRYFAIGLPDAVTVSAVTPATGLPVGGATLTLTGAGFAAGVTVRLGDTPALAVTRLSGTALTVVAPPHAWGAVAVTVINPDGASASLPNAFAYNTPPTANAGGPYAYTAGAEQDLTLDGSASSSGDAGEAATLTWDLDGDGVYDDATGPTPVVPWAAASALLDAGTWHFGAANLIRLRVVDALGAAAGGQTTVLAYRGVWSFTLNVLAGSQTQLTVGLSKSANDGADALDALATPPAGAAVSVLAAPGRQLAADYHAYDPRNPPLYSAWVVAVTAAADQPCVLSWDSAATAGLGRGGLWLFEAEPAPGGGIPAADGRLTPGGQRFDLSLEHSIAVQAGQSRSFRLVYGYVEQTLHLAAGWNLLSLPLEPRDPGVAALFAGTSRVGAAWTYDGTQRVYAKATELPALTGFWIYATPDAAGGGADIPVLGIPVSDQDYPLSPGGTWQLVGVAQSRPLEANPALIPPADGWNATTNAYRRVAPGGTLEPGHGYWFCVRQATTLNPQF
jgi:hypothetical protein